MLKKIGWMVLWRPTRPFRTNTQETCPYIIGDWNAKVESQETPGVTGKFGLGIRNEAGQRLIEFCQENALVIANTLFQQHKRRLYTSSSNTREDSTHGHHQMVNNKIRLIILFAAKDGEALYSQQKKTGSWLWLRSWTPYCQIQTEIKESRENHSSMTQIKSLMIIQ